MFNLPTQRKQRVLQLLQMITDDLKQNKIDVIEDAFVSAPHAFSLGLANTKTADFFGLAFHRLDRKEKEATIEADKSGPAGIVGELLATAPVKAVGPKGPEEPVLLQSNIKRKITDRECEQYRRGKEYCCPCNKFSSDKIVGFKTHFNRCQDRNN